MLSLSSDITIGQFRFSGVNDIKINRSIHNLSDTAVIKLPSIARIVREGTVMPQAVTTSTQFSEGDPVTISLGYNASLQTEFQGFVSRIGLDMPLEIQCEGFSWLLKRNSLKQFYPSVTLKDLLNAAVSGIDENYLVDVQCDLDLTLTNVRIDDQSGFDIIDSISKMSDGTIKCFFIQPNVLWCGLPSSAYAQGHDLFSLGKVDYRLGFNLPKKNTLRERSTDNDPVQVTYSKRLANGRVISAASVAYPKPASTQNKLLNHVSTQSGLASLANEKAYQLNYSGYEGSITSFLQPYASPGYLANIVDDRYPDRNGTYLIESTEVTFSTAGARRKLEIGAEIGFANN